MDEDQNIEQGPEDGKTESQEDVSENYHLENE
jgi:hypothetical protein